MRYAAMVLFLVLTLSGCANGNSVRLASTPIAPTQDIGDVTAALTTAEKLIREYGANPSLIGVAAWNKEWSDVWSVVFQNVKDGNLHEAATWCLAFADTEDLADFLTCGTYLQRAAGQEPSFTIPSSTSTPSAVIAKPMGSYLVTEVATVLDWPAANATGACRLPKGELVTVSKRQGEFAFIQATEYRCTGWIRDQFLEADE